MPTLVGRSGCRRRSSAWLSTAAPAFVEAAPTCRGNDLSNLPASPKPGRSEPTTSSTASGLFWRIDKAPAAALLAVRHDPFDR